MILKKYPLYLLASIFIVGLHLNILGCDVQTKKHTAKKETITAEVIPKYKILGFEDNRHKGSLTVEIEEEVSVETLKKISLNLAKKYNRNKYERMFIEYYLPRQRETGSGNWAVVRFDPNFKIEFTGMSKEDKDTLIAENKNCVYKNCVGQWFLQTIGTGLSRIVTIYQDNGTFKVEETFKGGDKITELLEVRNVRGKTRYYLKKTLNKKEDFEKYYLINNTGTLEIYEETEEDTDLVYTARKI